MAISKPHAVRLEQHVANHEPTIATTRHSIILKTQRFPCIRSRFGSKGQTTDIKMPTLTK